MRFSCLLIIPALLFQLSGSAQEEMWDKTSSGKEPASIKWFKDAKFGLFIHWGLYSQLAGTWKGKRYYGSGEWIMSQAKIPAAEYAGAAAGFNPVDFDADQWAGLAKEAGVRYLVITAKHHEGFAMFGTRASDFNIVQSTPFKRDPMKELAAATRKRGIPFGFYYSQFLDWHEPNGGGNKWDFEEGKKDYLRYYREKSIPQLKELMTNYGPLGIVWFDMPGGLTKEQTRTLVDSLRLLQPQCLFSSRVGQGMGDYKDFGDSEIPPAPIAGAWESIYTHNDSWGYISHDMDFKSSGEIVRLLAAVASRGGNLMLNVGPDGRGRIPAYSEKYLREVGHWLGKYGESIYGTTGGAVPGQPWGVTTNGKEKLYLHIFNRPLNGRVLVPGFDRTVKRVYRLGGGDLRWQRSGKDLLVTVPADTLRNPDRVVVVEYAGKAPDYPVDAPVTISAQYAENAVEAVSGHRYGNAELKSITSSHYYGDWKHATCITGMKEPGDSVSFQLRVTEPGDYRLILEYSCLKQSSKQEGVIGFSGQEYLFQTLYTSDYDSHQSLLFMRHPVAVTTIVEPGIFRLTVHPVQQGTELFRLKTVILEPVQ